MLPQISASMKSRCLPDFWLALDVRLLEITWRPRTATGYLSATASSDWNSVAFSLKTKAVDNFQLI